ncbi:MAG TPA: hypothetical protein VF777_01165 [Phycisphaerales bacterium]
MATSGMTSATGGRSAWSAGFGDGGTEEAGRGGVGRGVGEIEGRVADGSGGWGVWASWGLLWSGRAVATLLAIFWGVFFLEHLSEWYVQRGTAAFPPAWVTVVMVAHFGMIVGLLTLVRWRLVGALVTVGATLAFLYPTLVHAKPAWLVLVNVVPVAMIALGSMRRPR